MVQSACCYRFLLRFESFSKMEGYEGFITRWIWWPILTFIIILDISLLWMGKFGWNLWPNWRVFIVLADGRKILRAGEAGAKKSICLQIGKFWIQNFATSVSKKVKMEKMYEWKCATRWMKVIDIAQTWYLKEKFALI